jgi:hypothetical protein
MFFPSPDLTKLAEVRILVVDPEHSINTPVQANFLAIFFSAQNIISNF